MNTNGNTVSNRKPAQYVIVTAARNEEDYIEKTLRAVTCQTVPPMAWRIISDGSTDNTNTIVADYAKTYPYIHLQRQDGDSGRSFGSKARAINSAYSHLRTGRHAYVAILDADITFGRHYYEEMLKRFDKMPRLGIAGGILFDRHGDHYIRQNISIHWSVSGPVQMFRRVCFEHIDGYRPMANGIDAVAETMARMAGWQVCTFPNIFVRHNRSTGSAADAPAKSAFVQGRQDYLLGYDPIFSLGRSLLQLGCRPYVTGGLSMLGGYLSACICRPKRSIPRQVMRYLRREQRSRLLQCAR